MPYKTERCYLDVQGMSYVMGYLENAFVVMGVWNRFWILKPEICLENVRIIWGVSGEYLKCLRKMARR